MDSAIKFYFDFSSPYGYFAAMKIEALASNYGRRLEWHPILLGVVFKTTGSVPLTQIPIKGNYAVHDIARTARFHGIPYQHPSVFPLATQHAARAMLWVRTTYGDNKAVEFAKAVYHAYFVSGADVSQSDFIVQLATSLGVDGCALEAGMAGAPVKDQLRAETALAMEQGVFGSPFMIVDGESFWGFDRFDQMEELLKNGKI